LTQRFFPKGRVTAASYAAAETAARVEVEAIANEFGPKHWRDAYASSGTAAALAEILEQNGFSPAGITPAGLDRLRQRLVLAGHAGAPPAARPERVPKLAAPAIMACGRRAGMERIERGGALRLAFCTTCLAAASMRTCASHRRRSSNDIASNARGTRVACLAARSRQACRGMNAQVAVAMGWRRARGGMSYHIVFKARGSILQCRHAGILGRRAESPSAFVSVAAVVVQCLWSG
jgi:hypothetical protein